MSSLRLALVPLVSFGPLLGCATGVSADAPPKPSHSSSGGSAGTSGAAGTGGAMFSQSDGGLVVSNNLDTCAAEIKKGEPSPLDMYIMLDASNSMNAEVTAGTTKWEAVASAIATFVNADASQGIGVGLQFFPLIRPDSSTTCTTHEECGSGGPCQLSFCDADTDVVFCRDASDCTNPLSQCVPVGVCALNQAYVCPLGSRCRGLGDCIDFERSCVNATICDVAAYAEPAVPITPLPGGGGSIIDAIVNRTGMGLTPTGPALQGAIDHSKSWAEAHPDHAVVAVLATDGLPTECSPTDIDAIALIAAAGLGGTPSVRTFVIGVSSPGDLDSPDNLAAIAQFGGTGAPLFVDASADVTAQFLDALDKIRHTVLTCEFQIPAAPEGESLDYNKVNLQFTEGTSTRDLAHVGSADLCSATDDGWYYDHDPATGELPTKIVVCPGVCNDFKSSVDGVVNLEIGCETREAIIR